MKLALTTFFPLRENPKKQLIRHLKLCLIISLMSFHPLFAGVNTSKSNLQKIVVTGNVIGSNNEALPGVNIIEKGTTNGTITDENGHYSITVSSSSSVLVFSYVGYNTQEIPVNNKTQINVTLKENLKALEEVVVVGYGSMARSNVTGAISSVNSGQISKMPVPNVIDALRGQVSGVRITQGDGTPGADVGFKIRGVRSLGATSQPNDPNYVDPNAPLIVVDGVPYSGGKISDINPDDIESINILKDAASTSIYGASAANGVVLITTKSGSIGKPSINVTFSRGITQLEHKPTLFNGPEYVQYKIAGLQGNPYNIKPLTPESVLDPIELANYKAGKSIDWHDVMLRKGQIYKLGLSLTGGTDKFRYYSDGQVYSETGIVRHSNYNRYAYRVNADYIPYKFITIGARSQLILTTADETGTAIGPNNQPDFTHFIGDSPLGRIYDSTGALVPTVNGDQFQYNPLYRYAHSKVNRKTYRASIAPYIEIKILKGLSYKINSSIEVRSDAYNRWLDGEYDPQNIGLNTYAVMMNRNYNYLLDNILNYSHTFNEKHTINFTGVYGFQSNRGNTFRLDVQDNAQNYLGIYDIANAQPTTAKEYTTQYYPDLWGKAYFVGRINYSYDNRYNLTISRRWDYSSIFGPNKKEGVFPSYAAAWNISNEKFLEGNNFINNLKYRISWGEVGNDRIPAFSYLYTAANATYTFGGNVTSGWTSDQSGNYSLHWETSKQFNTGIDFGILSNRISGTFDYYKSKNTGILFNKQVPIIYGDADGHIMSNVAETKGWGLDALLTGKVVDGDFKWTISANWSKDVNKIVTLGQVDAQGKPVDDVANGWFVGQDINEIYDYKFIGIVQYADTTQQKKMHPDKKYYTAGDPKIADIDGNDTINAKDKTFLGSSVTPKWYGGITNTFSYKGFEISVLIETVQGIKKVNYLIGSYNGRGNTLKENYWTPTNQGGDFPQPNSAAIYDYNTAVRLQNASFVAIRNVSFSYSLPLALLKKSKIKKALIYVRGNNLKYFTKYQGYSPEEKFDPANGQLQSYPVSKIWTVGLDVTF